MNNWTLLEERSFYLKSKNGTEVWVEADIEADVSIFSGEIAIENLKFTNIKLTLNPADYASEETPMEDFISLYEYIPTNEIQRMAFRAAQMLQEYGQEIIKERLQQVGMDN